MPKLTFNYKAKSSAIRGRQSRQKSHSSIISLDLRISDDRKYVCCSQATVCCTSFVLLFIAFKRPCKCGACELAQSRHGNISALNSELQTYPVCFSRISRSSWVLGFHERNKLLTHFRLLLCKLPLVPFGSLWASLKTEPDTTDLITFNAELNKFVVLCITL